MYGMAYLFIYMERRHGSRQGCFKLNVSIFCPSPAVIISSSSSSLEKLNLEVLYTSHPCGNESGQLITYRACSNGSEMIWISENVLTATGSKKRTCASKQIMPFSFFSWLWLMKFSSCSLEFFNMGCKINQALPTGCYIIF